MGLSSDDMSDSILMKGGYKPGVFGVFRGAGAVLWGAGRLLKDGKLRSLAVVPVLLTAVLYILVMGLGFFFGPKVVDSLWNSQQWSHEGWLGAIGYWLVVVIALAAMMVLLILLFSTIAEAVGGPFYDKLAVRILDAHGIANQEPGFIEGMVPDLIRSLVFLGGVIVLAVFGWIPVVGVPFFVASAGLAWLGLAASAVNPALLVTGVKMGGRIRFVFRYFFTSLGMGAVIGLSLMVPFLGLVVIPSAIVGASELFATTDAAPAA